MYAYDFKALNEDSIPIYYNFSENGMSVVVTYRDILSEPLGMNNYSSDENYSGNILIPESVIYDNQLYTVTAIGDSAFYNCHDLTGIAIPNSVVSIGNQSFQDCFSLIDISIPDNVITIGNDAFGACIGLTNIYIPNNVNIIGDNAFAGCYKLTNATIGENVTYIGSGAFSACGIASIIIPDNVITIGIGAFAYCLNLKEFFVSEQNRNYSTIDGVLFNKDKTILVDYPNAKSSVYIIPDFVSTIGAYAFYNCQDLTDITIPQSVTTIEAMAFHGTKLNIVTIPDHVTKVGDYAFAACYELKKVVIPNSNISFGDNVFYGDDALEEIHNLSSIPQTIGRFSFIFVNKNLCKLFVPKGSLNAYKTADVWKDFNIFEEDYSSIPSINQWNISVLPIKGGISIIGNNLVKVIIFDVTGRIVHQSTFIGNKKISLVQGLYIVSVDGENEKILVK